MKPRALIDGDVVAYEAAFACQRVTEWEPGQFTTSGDLEEAKQCFKDKIKRILEGSGCATKGFVIALSCPTRRYWRHDILSSYKEHRGGTPPPVLLGAVKEWARSRPSAVFRDRLEGDDILGLLATAPGAPRSVICSVDKDLRQIPVPVFDWRRGSVTRGTVNEADRYHMMQTLTGDRVDNYTGCPGVGPVRAEEILNGPGPAWPKVVAAFEKKGLTEADALVQARVARILRASDWDRVNKKPIPWSPSKHES